MINESLIRRYMRHLILVVTLIVGVLAFVWINFLYARFDLDTQVFIEEQERELAASVAQRAQRVLREGNRSYLDEYEEVKVELKNLNDSLRGEFFTLHYTIGSEQETIHAELGETVNRLIEQTGYSIYVVDAGHDLTFGVAPTELPIVESNGHLQNGDILYYADSLRYPPGSIYVYTDSDAKVKERMTFTLSKYLEMDPSILAFDEHGENLAPNAYPATLELLEVENDIFFHVERSELSGFSFGYIVSREELDLMLANRQKLFSGFLRNHLWELGGFFVVLLIASSIVFRFFARSLRRDQEKMNDTLLRAYREETQLSEEPLFKHFSMMPTLNIIFDDMHQKEKALHEEKSELALALKQRDVRLLSLERRIRSLSDEKMFTEGLILEKRREEFSLLDLIHSTHEATDPHSPLELRGEPFLLESDPDLLEGILKDFFSLSHSEGHRYVIEVTRIEEQLQIFFSLKGTDAYDENILEHLKLLARNLEGTLLKDMPTNAGLRLSLLFPTAG